MEPARSYYDQQHITYTRTADQAHAKMRALRALEWELKQEQVAREQAAADILYYYSPNVRQWSKCVDIVCRVGAIVFCAFAVIFSFGLWIVGYETFMYRCVLVSIGTSLLCIFVACSMCFVTVRKATINTT